MIRLYYYKADAVPWISAGRFCCVFSNMKKPELRLMRGSGFRYGQVTSNQGSGRVRQDSGCAEYEESADSNPCCHTR